MLSPVRAVPGGTGGIKWAGPLMAVIVLQTAAAFLLQFLPTTAPILMRNLGWSESAIGYLMALTMCSAIICLQGAGSVVRRLGPVRAVQVGLMVGSLGVLALALPVFVAPLVACLLIGLQTGRRPDKRTVEIVGWYLLGLATEQDVIDFLNKPDNKGVKLRAKEELWKKLGW